MRIVNDDDRGMVAVFDGESRVEVRLSVFVTYRYVLDVTSSIDKDYVYSRTSCLLRAGHGFLPLVSLDSIEEDVAVQINLG